MTNNSTNNHLPLLLTRWDLHTNYSVRYLGRDRPTVGARQASRFTNMEYHQLPVGVRQAVCELLNDHTVAQVAQQLGIQQATVRQVWERQPR